MGLRKQILLRIAFPLTLGIFITVTLSTGLIYGASRRWITTTKERVLTEESDSLIRVSSTLATLLDTSFTQIIDEMNCYGNFVETVLDGYPIASPLRSFSGLSMVDDAVPGGLTYSARDQTNISTEAGFWYVKGVTSPSLITNHIRELMNITSVLDVFYKALYKSDTQFSLFVFTYTEDPFMKNYPFQNVDSWINYTYECPPGSGDILVGFDAKCRPWYRDAMMAGRTPDIPAPYITYSTNELCVSPGRTVYSNQQLTGVIIADISVNQIKNIVATTKILNRGYAYVVDTNGTVFYHPLQDLTQPPQLVIDLEFSASSEKEKLDFLPILDQMINGGTGNGIFSKASSPWYISFAPIPSANMSLVIVVPESDVSAPAYQVAAAIAQVIAVQLAVFIVIVVVTIVIISVITVIVSKRIVKPVLKLTRFTERLARGDFDIEMAEEPSASMKGSLELQTFYSTFRGLLTAVKFGNSSYFAGDWNTALKNYYNALSLFTEMENEKGIGLCYNNIGNVYHNQKDFKQSRDFFNKAITIAERLTTFPTHSPADAFRMKAVLAARLNNLALCEVAEGYKSDAETLLIRALKIDLQIGHVLQYATHAVNLADLLLDSKDAKQAYNVLQDCQTVVVTSPTPENSKLWLSPEEIDVATQYANYGMGLFYKCETNDFCTALKFFTMALEHGPVLDKYVQVECLKHMCLICEKHGLNDITSSVRKIVHSAASVERKDVVFVLDYSGCASDWLTEIVKNMKEFLNNCIYDQDSIGFLFSTNGDKTVLKLQKKEELNIDQIFMNNITTAPIMGLGEHAFYGSLLEAFEGLGPNNTNNNAKQHHNLNQWVVSILCGDIQNDHSYKMLLDQIKSSPANLIVIGVLLENNETKTHIRNLCSHSKEGIYIDVDYNMGVKGLDEAFKKSATLISGKITGRMNVETFSI